MTRNFHHRLIIAAILTCCLLSGAVKSENELLPVVHNNMVSTIKPEGNLAEASNRFGFKMFRELTAASNPGSNVCISPLSVSYALTMTCNGAAGETREAMASTLEMADFSADFVNDSYRKLTSALTASDPSLVMEIANSIWYRSGLVVKSSFLDLSRTTFDAMIRELDFSNPGAADIINQWVSGKTHDRIKTIVDPPIDPDVIMMLINAVYFKGAWTIPFDASLTKPTPFNLPDGSLTECQMMNKVDEYQYFENDKLQAVALPYGNGKFSMTVLLPQKGITVDELIGRLDGPELANWLNGLADRNVRLFLPRFKFSNDFGLNETLKSLGMAIAFDAQKADFSNMVDGRIWVDSVIHKTFIQVDEQGTEAAAATAVIMKKSFVPSMVVDRPFLFVIRHRESNTILFLGKVVNPVWENDQN